MTQSGNGRKSKLFPNPPLCQDTPDSPPAPQAEVVPEVVDGVVDFEVADVIVVVGFVPVEVVDAKVVETICLCGGSVTVKAAETGVV